MRVAGVILAGGRSSRMGGQDKAFALLDGRPMLAHVLTSLERQVAGVLINSNGNPADFAAFGCPVLPDCVPGRQGPLAGLLTGLLWAKRSLPGITHLFSAPCDIPGLPLDLGAKLMRALSKSEAQIAIARDEHGAQPTIGLWPVNLTARLEEDLVHRDIRGLQAWVRQFAVAEVPCRCLSNINTSTELRAAQRGNPNAHKETISSCAAP